MESAPQWIDANRMSVSLPPFFTVLPCPPARTWTFLKNGLIRAAEANYLMISHRCTSPQGTVTKKMGGGVSNRKRPLGPESSTLWGFTCERNEHLFFVRSWIYYYVWLLQSNRTKPAQIHTGLTSCDSDIEQALREDVQRISGTQMLPWMLISLRNSAIGWVRLTTVLCLKK